MEPQDAPKIRIGFPIALEPAEDGPPENQELGLVGRSPQPLRKHIHSLIGLFQAIQKSGEMQATFHVGRLQLEQLAIRPDRLTGERSGRQFIGALQPLFGDTPIAGWSLSCDLGCRQAAYRRRERGGSTASAGSFDRIWAGWWGQVIGYGLWARATDLRVREFRCTVW